MLVNFEVIKDMSAADQRQILVDLRKKQIETQAQLDNRDDYKKVVSLYNQMGATPDEAKKATEDLSPETRTLWEALETQSNQLREIKSYLYLHSSQAEIRKDMETIVDAFIRENFDEKKLIGCAPQHKDDVDKRIPETCYYQVLLHLSTFGGRMTKEKSGTYWSFSYEFNAEDADGNILGARWEPIEKLFAKGLLKFYEDAITDNNLTLLGQAVLARLSEMRPLPVEIFELKRSDPTEDPSNATSGERRRPQGSAVTAAPAAPK